MNSNTDDFQRVLAQVKQMPERQRQRFADGFEEDEHFIVWADEFASDEEFQRAVIAEIMKLVELR